MSAQPGARLVGATPNGRLGGWRTRLLWPVITLAVFTILALAWLWWSVVGSRLPNEVEPYAAFLDGLVGIIGLLVAMSVSGATIYYAKRTGDMVRLMEERDAVTRQRDRDGVVLAFIGAATETAGYAGWLGGLQRFGLKWYRRGPLESPAQREFLIAAWKPLAAAAGRVSAALERVRYETPDLEPQASAIFDAVMEAVHLASEGESEEDLLRAAATIRERADRLRQATVEGS